MQTACERRGRSVKNNTNTIHQTPDSYSQQLTAQQPCVHGVLLIHKWQILSNIIASDMKCLAACSILYIHQKHATCHLTLVCVNNLMLLLLEKRHPPSLSAENCVHKTRSTDCRACPPLSLSTAWHHANPLPRTPYDIVTDIRHTAHISALHMRCGLFCNLRHRTYLLLASSAYG